MQTTLGQETAAKVAAAWPEILGAVASGANIGKACAAIGIKREWVYAYQLNRPTAREEWERAKELSADYYADQVAELVANNSAEPNATRVRIDGLKWLAAKRNPKAYSDKAQLDVNVRTVDLTRIIEAANARLAAAQAPRVIEGEVLRAALPASLAEIL